MTVPVEATLVADLLRSLLGADLLAVWLHGSATAGGLQPDSDVDLLALTARPLEPGDRDRLLAGVLPLSGRSAAAGPARPVELTVVARGDVVPWRYPPTCDLLYGEWLRPAVQAGRPPRREAAPDLAVAITVVRDGGVPVLGPAPRDLLEPVPAADLRAAVLAGVPGLLDDLVGDERNVLLTLARIVVTLGTGAIVPKDAAARSVAPQLPAGSAELLLTAGRAYLGEVTDDWSARRSGAADAARDLAALIDATAGAQASAPSVTPP